MTDNYLPCVGKKITRLSFDVDDVIKIYFNDDNLYMILQAYADCCSESWFQLKWINNNNNDNDNDNDNDICGKIFKSIEYVEDIDLPKSGMQERDANHLYRIFFDDDTHFDFILRNSSNGYYDGWIGISLIEYKNIIETSIYPHSK